VVRPKNSKTVLFLILLNVFCFFLLILTVFSFVKKIRTWQRIELHKLISLVGAEVSGILMAAARAESTGARPNRDQYGPRWKRGAGACRQPSPASPAAAAAAIAGGAAQRDISPS